MAGACGTPPLDQLILEQAADALIYANRRGIIERWNQAAATLFGFSADEAIGQSLDLIIPERLRAGHWRGFDAAMMHGAAQHGRVSRVTKALVRGGGSIYVDMSFAVVCDGSGVAIGSVAVARDVSARYREEQALKKRLAELEGNGGQ